MRKQKGKIMTLQNRKEKSVLHYNLISVLTANITTDQQFLKRLLMAQEIIQNEISHFTPDEIESAYDALAH